MSTPENRNRPDSRYYDKPYIPNDKELSEWDSVPLRPVEAHSILVNNLENLSEAQKAALRSIIDEDDYPDQEVDYKSILSQFSDDDED
jgi:hypothetical protein